MGRHGGGSRSGGRSRSSGRHGGGSRSGGSSYTKINGSGPKFSTTRFPGGHNKSYYDRHGRYHSYYTSDISFGTKPGWNKNVIISLILIAMYMIMAISVVYLTIPPVNFADKVQGKIKRIQIVDTVDILTQDEEKNIMKLFYKVYDKSGMPITLYTDDFDWKEQYYSLEAYSEKLYYQMGYDEDAMIILFTTNFDEEFQDWEYDFYCGDDTIKCLSDSTFDKLLDNFHKAMANQNLAHALDYSWNSVMDDLAKTTFNVVSIFILMFIGLLFGSAFVGVIQSAMKKHDVYVYFKENGRPASEKTICDEKTDISENLER